MTATTKSLLNFEHLTRVYHRDPTQVRQGRVLSVLLIGMGIAATVGVLLTIVSGLTTNLTQQTNGIVVVGLVLLGLVIGLYFLNRFTSPRIAAILFLLGLVVILTFSDSPQELVDGRTTLTFVLPIIMASSIIRPGASFIFAALASMVLGLVAF